MMFLFVSVERIAVMSAWRDIEEWVCAMLQTAERQRCSKDWLHNKLAGDEMPCHDSIKFDFFFLSPPADCAPHSMCHVQCGAMRAFSWVFTLFCLEIVEFEQYAQRLAQPTSCAVPAGRQLTKCQQQQQKNGRKMYLLFFSLLLIAFDPKNLSIQWRGACAECWRSKKCLQTITVFCLSPILRCVPFHLFVFWFYKISLCGCICRRPPACMRRLESKSFWFILNHFFLLHSFWNAKTRTLAQFTDFTMAARVQYHDANEIFNLNSRCSRYSWYTIKCE